MGKISLLSPAVKCGFVYKLIDLGTLGGPDTYLPTGPPQFSLLNSRGVVVGSSATSAPDPYYPYCLVDCYLAHTFQWKDGVLADLGALPGNNGSLAFGINDWGVIEGISENRSYDPTTGFPIYRAVIWHGGKITDLGTLGGNSAEPSGINNWGQVVGGPVVAVVSQGRTGSYSQLSTRAPSAPLTSETVVP